METVTRKTVTNLTAESVSILTQQFEISEEKETQVGSNHRCAYTNSASGREFLVANEPEATVAEVMEVWGDEPTVEEPDFSDYVPAPTIEERITTLEEKVTNSNQEDTWDAIAQAIEEGVNEV